MAIQHLRSSTANKRPTPAAMSDGQVAINSNTASPGLFFKDSAGALIKVGPVHVGTTAPNASPAAGGQTGNTVGEQWLDTTGGTYVFKVWDGSAWRSETGEFVNTSGDVMTGALGIIAGSAASPSLYISGDTNTGIYSPGADQLAISTNGTGALFIDASGQVGIGRQPLAARVLSVQGRVGVVNQSGSNDTQLALYSDGTTNGIYSTYNATGSYVPLTFYTSDVERARIRTDGMFEVKGNGTAGSSPAVSFNGSAPSNSLVVDSSGNVGVGVSPAAKLHVYGTYGYFQDGTYNGYFGKGSGVVVGAAASDLGISSSTGSIVFGTGASLNERFRITSDGKLGLGTSSPDTLFTCSTTDNTIAARFKAANGIFRILPFETGAGVKVAALNGNESAFANLVQQGASHQFVVGINTAVTIDSSSRVGIGTTTVNSEAKAVISNGGAEGLEFRAGNTSGVCEIITYNRSGAAHTDFRYDALSHQWKIAGEEKARLDNSGRLLVGTVSSFNGGDQQYAKIQVVGSTASASGAGLFAIGRGEAATSITVDERLGSISFSDNGAGEFGRIECIADGTAGSGDYPGRLVFSTTADGAASPTERMRIKSNGSISINNASDFPGSGNTATGLFFEVAADGATIFSSRGAGRSANFNLNADGEVVRLCRSGVDVGSIDVTTTATSYNTSSDYRLKENVVPLTGAADRLNQLQVHRFNFIADPDTTVDGFIAHEAQAVVPECVTGTKDEVDDEGNPVYQGIDQSKLVPLLTAALQEALGRIETLEAEVAALKAQ